MSLANATAGQLMAVLEPYAKSAYPAGPSRESFTRSRSAGSEIALIEISGVQYKRDHVAARMKVNAAAANDQVAEILLLTDSPGGSSMGCHDLFLAIREAAKVKPVRTFIEDMGASAAYFACCAATEIVCNASALVGGIGTYMVLVDSSRALQAAGIDVIVVRAGKFKGVGEWGARISQEEIDQVQHVVDQINRGFLAAVSAGRKMDPRRIQDIADGRVFVGPEAVAAGLVDRISTFEAFVSDAYDRLERSYLHLTGKDAVSQFNQLVAAKTYLAPAAARDAVYRDFPILAQRATSFEKQLAEETADRLRAKRRCGM